MLMCCVREWCIHTELAVVKCVNVLDRSLAGLSSLHLKTRAEFSPSGFDSRDYGGCVYPV